MTREEAEKCEHNSWVATVEQEGGCRENPGVWSQGGTKITVSDHCEVCGMKRNQVFYGSQRNYGEEDSVSYYR
jgi:hypothetical protein